MIDIHVHIIPGVDDGPLYLEQSLEMAEATVADGIDTVVATPHGTDVAEYLAGSGVSSRDFIVERTAWLQDRLNESGIALKVIPGVEAHIDPSLPKQLQSQTIFGINDTKYVLIELPFENYPQYVEETMFAVQVKGYVPILAHPERNSEIRRRPELLVGMVERGCLAQVTAASILGLFGREVKQVTAEFLRSNLAHIISTDTHGIGRREPVISESVQEAARIIGEERAQAMVTSIPAAIIAGQPLDLPEPASMKKKWSLFGR